MEILLANPRGFCAGVDRAIEIVNRALELFGAPIYVRHEVVHNKYVVERLRAKGAVFVEELDEVPEGATLIFSAHGVSQQVRQEAQSRALKVFDATCPLVTKVHMEVARISRRDESCILIGHKGHPEVEGTLGQYDSQAGTIALVESVEDVANLEMPEGASLHYVTQTTLSVDDTRIIIDALREKFVDIKGPKKDDICYATQNRQDAVRSLAIQCDLMLVVGSANSSNSNRLKELAENCGTRAYLINGVDEIEPDWLTGVRRVGVTAGASAPEVLVKQVIAGLREEGGVSAEEADGTPESVVFALPAELR